MLDRLCIVNIILKYFCYYVLYRLIFQLFLLPYIIGRAKHSQKGLFNVPSILLDRFVRAFPRQFLTRILERQQALYEQSIAWSVKDQSWESAEADYVAPHIRRALFESEFRMAAKDCGLKTFDSYHAGANCQYVMVKAAGLIITEHYVDGPRQFVQPAKSREQNSGVNDWLDEYTDERLLIHPLPKIGRAAIYFNLLHGAAFSTSASGDTSIIVDSCFLRIAIPDDKFKKYLYNWSIQEVLMAYAEIPDSATAPQAIEDKAQPRPKLKVKKRAAGSTE